MNAKEQDGSKSQARFLLDLKDGETGIIRTNGDHKSAEMGLFPGVRVAMFRNRASERSVVIGAGDARFLVSRVIAQKVELEVSGRE